MNLSEYKFPDVTKVDLAFSSFSVPKDLLEEAQKRNPEKGIEKFNELFYTGGKITLQDDVVGTWKEKAFAWCKAMMRSFEPKHEHKEIVAAMIFEECLVL